MIIAVDGPAAAGKGTLARRIAALYNLAYLDTGALYRAVALSLLKAGNDPSDGKAADKASRSLNVSLLSDPDLRSEATGGAASVVAAIPVVRKNLMDFQKKFANSPPEPHKGAVLDGRDIGTVICPDATVKLFITASAEERARRRIRELEERGEVANFDKILDDVKARDARDMSREDAPLRPAEDAHLLDTTDLDIEAALDRAVRIIKPYLAVR